MYIPGAGGTLPTQREVAAQDGSTLSRQCGQYQPGPKVVAQPHRSSMAALAFPASHALRLKGKQEVTITLLMPTSSTPDLKVGRRAKFSSCCVPRTESGFLHT